MKNIMIIAVALLFLAGCASTYNVNLASYGGKENYSSKTFELKLSKKIKSDLEYLEYTKLLKKKLECSGWVEDTSSPAYIIEPDFGTMTMEVERESSSGFSIGFMGGSFGSGVSLGTAIAGGNKPEMRLVNYLNLKLFESASSETPVWQGKVINLDAGKKLSDVAPVLTKYAVDNFGRQSDGEEHFEFKATEKNLKALTECSNGE